MRTHRFYHIGCLFLLTDTALDLRRTGRNAACRGGRGMKAAGCHHGALHALRLNKLRSALTMLGIVIGIGSVIT
jgi:hypothetical protein